MACKAEIIFPFVYNDTLPNAAVKTSVVAHAAIIFLARLKLRTKTLSTRSTGMCEKNRLPSEQAAQERPDVQVTPGTFRPRRKADHVRRAVHEQRHRFALGVIHA